MIAQAWGADPMLLLGELCGSGLLTRDKDKSYAFHELVAERADEWMKSHPADRAQETEIEVWTAYGEWYGAVYNTLITSPKPGSRDTASEMGRRGIHYLVHARAYDSLGAFASHVVTGTSDPALLGTIVADLQTVAAEVPAGQAGWRLWTYLAVALARTGKSDKALPLYAQAIKEADGVGLWSDVGWICQNWAVALRNVGQLDRARQTYLRSAEAQRRAGHPRVNVAISEQEALRIEVHQGRAAEALPGIEQRVAEVRAYWVRHRQGQPVPEAPDGEVLARALVSGLDVAQHANVVLQRWQPCLDMIGEIEDVERALGTGEHEIARARFNRYLPLMRLGQVPEARTVLEGCLEVDRRVGDISGEARDLSALAEVWNALGDPGQALAFERQALALLERLPDPGDRAASHHNLAIYLHATGTPTEALPHQLAALTYLLATGHDLRDFRDNLAIRIRESAARGERFAFPPLAALLADPAFAPLRAFLQQHGASPEALQTRIDALVDEIRAEVGAEQA